jgi:hypothetical protein
MTRAFIWHPTWHTLNKFQNFHTSGSSVGVGAWRLGPAIACFWLFWLQHYLFKTSVTRAFIWYPTWHTLNKFQNFHTSGSSVGVGAWRLGPATACFWLFWLQHYLFETSVTRAFIWYPTWHILGKLQNLHTSGSSVGVGAWHLGPAIAFFWLFWLKHYLFKTSVTRAFIWYPTWHTLNKFLKLTYFSHTEITTAAILDLGQHIKNPRKTRGYIGERWLCAK